MKRLVLRKPFEAVVEEVARPEPGPGEALVRAGAVGVCGTDIRAWQGLHSFLTYPRVPGHEVAGEVIAFGPETETRGIRPGEAVVVEPMVACGRCYPCSLCRYNCCEHLEVLGVHRDGAMQEYFAVPVSLLHRAPAGFNFAALSFVEPACVARHAVRRSRVRAGDTAAVIGSGNIGLLLIQMLKLEGARVIAVDVRDSRLELARRLGADLTVNSKAEDPVRRTLEFTDGVGAPEVFEVVGTASTVKLALDLVSYAGQVVLVGVCHDEVTFRPDLLNKRELDLLGSRNSRGLFPEVLRLLEEGRLVTEELITRRIALDEFDAAMREVTSGARDEIKTVIEL
ncbi:MAG TPA: zinc-binding alcohol dehydrogenase family protein [Firmicutes bacterium]|nr:zinc-binding alcohol dehydrogenase family protein [Bacillota bacterium]